MKARLLAGLIGAGVLFAPLVSAASPKKKNAAMSEDMRRAIAFERHKDAAAARQARLEARHPERSADRSANRTTEESQPEGRPVKDPGPKH